MAKYSLTKGPVADNVWALTKDPDATKIEITKNPGFDTVAFSKNAATQVSLENAGGGGGGIVAVATFTSTFTNGTATPAGSAPVGTYTYTRALTTQTITDFEGLASETLAQEIGYRGLRRVANLATGLVTEANIPVIIGNEYQVTIQGGSGDTAVCSDAFTGTLTADGANRISWNSGTPKTAATATLDIAVTGTLTELLVEDVTGQTVKVPSEQIVGTEHGTGVATVMYKTYENAITVNGSGVVDESGNPGTTIPVTTTNKGIELWKAATNLIGESDDLGTTWANTWSGGTTLTLNASSSPDGSQTADKIAQIDSVPDGIAYSLVLSASTDYIDSIYIKNVDSTQTRIFMFDDSNGVLRTDIRIGWTGSVPSTTSSSNISNILYENVIDDWYRLSFKWSTAVGGINHRFVIAPESLATATNGIYVSKVNLVQDSFVSPPISTDGAAASRNESDLNYSSSNYTDAGWLICEFDVTQDQLDNFAAVPHLFSIQDNNSTWYIRARIEADATTLRVSSNASGGSNSQDHTISAGHYKLAITWDTSVGTLRQSFDGGAAVGATTANTVIPAANTTKFEIGHFDTGTNTGFWNGTIQNIQIGTGLIDDAELVSKST